MFLYAEPGAYAAAFMIIPRSCQEHYFRVDAPITDVQHQYGCCACQQFYLEEVKIVPMEDERAKKFRDLLGRCEYASPEVLSMHTGMKVIAVLGEGLCELEDGRFIAVENCD